MALSSLNIVCKVARGLSTDRESLSTICRDVRIARAHPHSLKYSLSLSIYIYTYICLSLSFSLAVVVVADGLGSSLGRA